nr:uncharacterized protein LOC124808992 [Hydra vulgaris]
MIALNVIKIWQTVNPKLPLYEHYYVVKLINKLCFMKAQQINQKSLSKVKRNNLEKTLDTLFDISACKCNLPVRSCNDKFVKYVEENCQTQHIICTCPLDRKVPLEHRMYLKDQRAKIGPKGLFQLGSIDRKSVNKTNKTSVSNKKCQKQILNKVSQEKYITYTSFDNNMESLDSLAVMNEDEDLKSYSSEMSEVLKTPVNFDNECCYKAIISGAYNFFKPSRYALELIRADVSSRIGASLGNAFLLDLQATGLLVPNLNLNTVFIDKSKIDRQKTRVKKSK